MGLISRVSSRTYRSKKTTTTTTMGRMHAPGKGISSSALPYVRKAPNWLRMSKDDIVDSIIKLSKKGYRPSAIGVQIRDQYGVSQSKYVTGNKILRVLKAQGMQPEIPEDLYFLIKKAVTMRKHLERNRKDKHGKFRLILVESRIHRLARYYKTQNVLAPSWKYDSATASALVA